LAKKQYGDNLPETVIKTSKPAGPREEKRRGSVSANGLRVKVEAGRKGSRSAVNTVVRARERDGGEPEELQEERDKWETG